MDELGITPAMGKPAQSKRKLLPPGTAVQIVRLESGTSSRGSRNLRLNTQVLRELLSKANDYPIATIVIAGPGRKGKSLMLTYIVRYLQALEWSEDGVAGDWMDKANPDKSLKEKGFTFRHGMDKTTDGIWMWSRPFIIKNSRTNSPIAVLVMDTEGCFDPYTNEQEQSSIIGLSLLLSSCFIYNDSGLINESTITTLAQFMQYGQVASQSFDGKAFQRLMFLVRDWATSGFDYGATGGQEFIRKCLSSNPRMSEQANKNRQLILGNFEDYNAYLMPFPGKKVISEDFTGSIGEMKEEFRNHVENFVSNLVADVVPKRFGNMVANSQTFFDTFDKFSVAFNEEDMPSPASILEVTVYIALDAQIRKLTQEYETEFQKKLGSKNVPFFSSGTIQKYHKKYSEVAQQKFTGGRRLGSPKDHQVFEEKLDQSIGHMFSEINKSNLKKQQKFAETIQQSFIEKMQNFVEQNIIKTSKIWSKQEYETETSPVVDKITHEFSAALNGTTNDFIQEQMSIFKSKLQETIQSYSRDLKERKRKAEERAREIVTQVLSNYTTCMNILISTDVLLDERRLETLHEKHKIKNIQDASNKFRKEFSDQDFIQRFNNELENVINANFEPIKTNCKAQIEGIRSIMDEDLREIVAVFKEESEKEMQKHSSLDNPNLEKLFSKILDVGIETLDSRKLPDLQIAADYRKQLKIDMSLALQEIKDAVLQSREYKLQHCESTFQATAEAFRRAIEDQCSSNDLLAAQEVESIVGQTAQHMRPSYEQTIRELSPEDLADFLKRFDEHIVKKKQELISDNLVKAQQLEKVVYDKIDRLSEVYNQEMKIQENHWTKQDHVSSSHSTLMTELLERLQSETPLQSFPRFTEKYHNQLEKEIQKYYEIFSSRFELNVHQRDKILREMIPEWISTFENEIQNYARNNPFADTFVLSQEMGERTSELETKLKQYASEAKVSSLIMHDVIKTLEEEINKVKMGLIEHASEARKTAEKNVALIIESCLQFADNNSIFHDNAVTDPSVFDEALGKLKVDVRGYYDSKWIFPAQSSDQEKAKTWNRIQEELTSKFQDLIDKLVAKTREQSSVVNLITESVLRNVLQTVKINLDNDMYYEDEYFNKLLPIEARRTAKNEFERRLSEKRISHSEKMQTFEAIFDAKLDELSKQNTQVMQVAFAEAKAVCHNLIDKRREVIKSHRDVNELRAEAEKIMRGYMQSKSIDPLSEKSEVVTMVQTFIDTLYQQHLEHLESSVSPAQATKVTEEAVSMYDSTMRKFLDDRSPVNPENLLEFHNFSVKSTLKRSSKSCFITKGLELAIIQRLEYSYGIFQEQNNLSHAQGSNMAIGIDLGTTTSCVAVYQNGQVTVIRDDSGRTLTPSYVYFDGDGTPIAGNEAKNHASHFPENTIFDAKRLIGRQFNDPHVQNDMKTWPFKVEPDDSGRPLIVVNDRRYSPEGVSAKVLRHMRKLAEKHLNQKITKAVITVPANFTDRQRDATRQAALLAGLEVLQMINEPTAAAMAYSLNWKHGKKIVLVFDFGGGTFDVTILKSEVGSANARTYTEDQPSSSGTTIGLREASNAHNQSEGSRLQVLKTSGDTHLGGEDFDARMVNHCADKFINQHGISLLDVDSSTGSLTNVQARNRRLRRLRNECEIAKANLTAASSTTVEVDSIHGELDLKVSISRSEFERMNENLFQQAIDIVRTAIQDANLEPRDITDVLMVGGSSRIPRVRKLLQDFLGLPVLNINQTVDIQEAVAMGAAIQACVLNGGATVYNLPLIRDIQPFSLGIKVHTGNMSIIIHKNTSIPCEASNTYYTAKNNQTAVTVDIYTGEEKRALDNVLLGTFTLEGIPPGEAGSQSVKVHMKIDASGILNVTASTPRGLMEALTIQECRGRYSEEEMAEMRRDLEQ